MTKRGEGCSRLPWCESSTSNGTICCLFMSIQGGPNRAADAASFPAGIRIQASSRKNNPPWCRDYLRWVLPIRLLDSDLVCPPTHSGSQLVNQQISHFSCPSTSSGSVHPSCLASVNCKLYECGQRKISSRTRYLFSCLQNVLNLTKLSIWIFRPH